MLRIASRALDAQRYGLDVTGQNIANVNTAGYTRRSVVFSEVPPLDPWSPGGGVDVQKLVAARAPAHRSPPPIRAAGLVARRRHCGSSRRRRSRFGQPGASLDAALARFYNTYAALAQSPTSATARQQVIIEGQTLSRTFNDLATSFNDAQMNADRELRDTVSQVNPLAKQIADINAGIASAGPENADGLLDQQSVALASLTELTDVTVTHNDDGTVDVSIGSGRSLVVGANDVRLDGNVHAAAGIRADHVRRGRRADRRHVGNHRRQASPDSCKCATSSCRNTSPSSINSRTAYRPM